MQIRVDVLKILFWNLEYLKSSSLDINDRVYKMWTNIATINLYLLVSSFLNNSLLPINIKSIKIPTPEQNPQ